MAERQSLGKRFRGGGRFIRHRRGDLPERIEFYHRASKTIIQQLEAAGFVGASHPSSPQEVVRQPFPFRLAFVVSVPLGWNLLIGADLARGRLPGLFTLIALWGMFGIASLVIRSENFRAVVLRKGSTLGYHIGAVRFVQLMLAVMAVAATAIALLGVDLLMP